MAASKQKESQALKAPRRLKQREYKRFRFSRRIKHPAPALRPARKIFWDSLKLLWSGRRGFSWMFIIYGILSLIFVHGVGSTSQLAQTKELLASTSGDSAINQLGSGVSLFGDLIGTSITSSGGAGYQTALLLVMSLTLIWALRTAHTGKERLRAKLAFYKGMTATVPFILVMIVICLELIPFLASTQLYSVVRANGLATTVLEQFLWGFMVFILTLWSFYMISSTIFALYIVTLPEATPVKAMRAARSLVRYRRWTVLRKVLYLPIILTIIFGAVMLPILLWATHIADWTFFVLGLGIIFVVHAYYYTLYRELL
jgi:hypothetical protein